MSYLEEQWLTIKLLTGLLFSSDQEACCTVNDAVSKTQTKHARQRFLQQKAQVAFALLRRLGARGNAIIDGEMGEMLDPRILVTGFIKIDCTRLLPPSDSRSFPCYDVGLLSFPAQQEVEPNIRRLLQQLKPGAWVVLISTSDGLSGDLVKLVVRSGIQVDGINRRMLWGRKALSLSVKSTTSAHHYARIKSMIDRAVGVGILGVTLPLQLLIGAFIRLTSPGPALFRQTRVGKDGKLFTFYKFRTMWFDALERFPEMYNYQFSPDQIATMKFKSEDDPRHTPFGRWLRRISMDELPNFLNVARGDVSLVGPRPDIPDMVMYYNPTQLDKLSVKPGVTGLAQINGRENLTLQQTLDYDIRYVQQCSWKADLVILLKTIQHLLSRIWGS